MARKRSNLSINFLKLFATYENFKDEGRKKMKKCPTCDKTFDDNLRFCQTDGTPLITATAEDPYKTMVASQDEISAALPIDPFATMVGGMPIKLEEDEEEFLELPDKPDSLKPPIFSQEDIKTQIKTGETDLVIDLPPASPFSSPPPTYPPPIKSSGDLTAAPPSPPKFNEPSVHPPSFGDVSSPKESLSDKSSSTETAPPFKPTSQSPFDKPASLPSQSPFDKPQSPPIPSPFDKSMPPGYHPPTTPPFAEPEKPSAVGQDSFNQSPFGQPQNPLEQKLSQPATWSPPPAPDASWQNQEIGQNTPFQPPVAAGAGQNQTLAIVSLVCGILGLICCWSFIPGLAALVTGFMAKGKADENPNEYGGRGLALGGIITGAISLLLGIILVILQVFFGVLAGIFGNV